MMKTQESNTLRVPPQWRGHFKELQTLRKCLLKNRENPKACFSSAMIGRSIVLGILAQDPDALSEVDAAIARILDGTFGICEKTGQPIPESRLRVVPWTRFTKEALEDAERGKMAERLPRNTVAWLAPA